MLHWCDPSYVATLKEIECKTKTNMHIQAVLNIYRTKFPNKKSLGKDHTRGLENGGKRK